MRFTTVFLLATAPLASGFINPDPMSVKPGLMEIVNSQPEQRFTVDLNIGDEKDASRLAIKGMVLDLHNDAADNEACVAMPGINGPHPKLSSGIRRLDMIEEGSFVSMMGTQVVKAVKGCWEMVWRKDSPAGAVLCGFEIPEEYQRNDAKLEKGRVYLSFPVWTKETLAYAQGEKERILSAAEKHLEEKNRALEQVQETRNPLMKALHYRNAYAAAEKIYNAPVKRMQKVPDLDEVVEIQNNLFLTTKGLVWTKALPRGEQILLGTASLSPVLSS